MVANSNLLHNLYMYTRCIIILLLVVAFLNDLTGIVSWKVKLGEVSCHHCPLAMLLMFV